MKSLHRIAVACAAACLLLLTACLFGTGTDPDRVAGGGSETEYISLTGLLTTPSGAAAAGCRIAIRPVGFLYDPEFPKGPGERDTVTDAKGSFSVKGLPEGEYLVEAAQGDSLGFAVRTSVAAKPDDTVRNAVGARLVGSLQPNGTLTVGIAEAKADLDYYILVFGMERRALADSNGIARVTLPPGAYRVRVISGSRDLAPQTFSEVIIRSGSDTSLPSVFLPPAAGPAPVPLIFDCNIGFAVDDAAALTLLHAMADHGEARILAVGTTNPTFASPSVLDAIDTYHGRGNVPVGAWKGEAPAAGNGYDQQIASEFPHDLPAWDSVPDAAAVYRRALEGQPDGSTVLVCTGDVRNAWALLRASRDLVARKVKSLVLVGGKYPSGREYNFAAGIARDTLPNMIRELVEGWPGPIRFVGTETGDDMATGGCLASAGTGGPLKRIYDLRLTAPNYIRPSTDLISVMVAVRGPRTYWDLVSEGGNVIGEDGSNVWNPAPDTDQDYLLRKGGPEAVGAAMDSLLCAIPAP
ncbi:MAG: Inosine/uridine-preferring nucleoside hydrolase [Fibrobacteres bacterium]|nr:Inosine/uridine-preferring nucleoside hydrolase [Fibrobacterota bacterium]